LRAFACGSYVSNFSRTPPTPSAEAGKNVSIAITYPYSQARKPALKAH
jgi:hypothetical protein